MSFQAYTWAVEMGKRYELPAASRLLLLMLANYADPEGNDIYPSIARLGADTGLSEDTVRRQLKYLMDCRLLEYGDQEAALKIKRADRRPKVYRLIMTPTGSHATGSHDATSLASTGSHGAAQRGRKRGSTMRPELKNQSEEPTRACRSCDRTRPEAALSESGLCPDCIGPASGPSRAAKPMPDYLRQARRALSMPA